MTTMAEVLRPAFAKRIVTGSIAAGVPARTAVRTASFAFDAFLVLAGSAFIALSAQVAFTLPFSPVPITAQTLAVLLVGSVLGSSRGAHAVLAYLAEGAAGLPVFAGGSGGISALIGPTGGYLFGFVLGAWLCGALAERGWDRSPSAVLGSMMLGNVVILIPGLFWLAFFVGAERVLALGLVPYIPGDLVKIGLAAALLPLGWKYLGRRTGRRAI